MRMGNMDRSAPYQDRNAEMVLDGEGAHDENADYAHDAADASVDAEREKPEIINAKRRERIAKGSGTTMADVNRLLKQFEDTRKMMKTVAGGNFQQQMQRMQRGGMRRR